MNKNAIVTVSLSTAIISSGICVVYFVTKLEDKELINSLIDLFTAMITTGLSAIIAYYVAYSQINKEQEINKLNSKEKEIKIFNKLIVELKDNNKVIENMIKDSNQNGRAHTFNLNVSHEIWKAVKFDIEIDPILEANFSTLEKNSIIIGNLTDLEIDNNTLERFNNQSSKIISKLEELLT